MSWEYIYKILGIQDFIYFITAPEIQSTLLPIKIVFILFSVFFFCAVIYFYINSSYLRYHFLQDTAEFISWQPYGLRQIDKRWRKIMKNINSGDQSEEEYKLAIVEADDFLYKTLEDRGYEGETFQELIDAASKKISPSHQDIYLAHGIRDSIVHDPDYRLDVELAKKILTNYEKAVKNL